MKQVATFRFFSAIKSNEPSHWNEFFISWSETQLELFHNGKMLNKFDEIRKFGNLSVCVCRNQDGWYVVNQSGSLCGPYAEVADTLFIYQDRTYIEVRKKDDSGNLRMNVLDIAAGAHLYVHKQVRKNSFNKQVRHFSKTLDWPFWKSLKDMDGKLIIVERSEGNYAFHNSTILNGAPLLSHIDRYQHLPDGTYIVHDTSKKGMGEYVKIESNGSKSLEYCSGFLSEEDLKKEKRVVANPADGVAVQDSGNVAVKEVIPGNFVQLVMASARDLLKLSPREQVAEALYVMFGNRSEELLKVSPLMSRSWRQLCPKVSLADIVDEAYLDKLGVYFQNAGMADDYEICRKYWQRHFDSPYDVLMKLREEKGICHMVEQGILKLNQPYEAALRPSETGIKACFRAFVEGLDEKTMAA